MFVMAHLSGLIPNLCSSASTWLVEMFSTFFILIQSDKIIPKSYSTVTDFAKFLGWSTSLPKNSAIWYANNCRGTIAIIGEINS